jgi:hypothetical protein
VAKPVSSDQSDYFRVADHLDKTRAISTVGSLFPGPEMQGVVHRPVRALDPMELKRTDPLRLLVQAYCFFSGSGAACEAAAAPVGAFVRGSARNLPIICGTSAEVMKL